MYTWNKELFSGISGMDEQHKRLLLLYNALHGACEGEGDPIEVATALELLLGYACRHFLDEERLQLAYQYPGYTQHKAQHDAFMDALHAFGLQLGREGLELLQCDQGYARLGAWLVSHMAREDRKLAEYLHAAGAAGNTEASMAQ